MSLSPEQVRNIARLARIAITDAEAATVRDQLNGILGLIERMQAVDTSGIAPMAHAQDLSQRLRDDRVTESDRHEAFQSVAPEVEAGLYLVPRVME
ncbi:MAG: Asp-tRNA(Asn)/Glu-tRNA(Gln) amidotransferase subunit GatC [Betaproteobacteria bacterium]|nr:Asp-tRNA(Asn)/Glu-tRNA(Gln) amidotransferase subunit GatC [Betaproteobacteria bacterium]